MYTVFDIEATGLDFTSDEILEIGAVRGKQKFHRLIKPISRSISSEITKLTGITAEEVAEKGISLSQALTEFAEFSKGSTLVAHNGLGYDYIMMAAEAKRKGLRLPENKVLDTLPLARKYLTTNNNRHRLQDLAESYNITNNKAHRALSDAETTAQIFEVIQKKAKGAQFTTETLNFGLLERERDKLRVLLQKEPSHETARILARLEQIVPYKKKSFIQEAIVPWIKAHPYKVGIGIGLGAIWASNKIFGKDDAYNTIEGMSESGLAAQLRKQYTDFGSGYKGDDKENSVIFGAGVGAATYFSFYPWGISKYDPRKYPQLHKIRQISAQGFTTYSPAIYENISQPDKIKRTISNVLFGSLHPTKSIRQDKGVVWIHSVSSFKELPSIAPLYVNWGNWDIGTDKGATWEYFVNKGKQDLHAETILGADFYLKEGNKITGLSPKAQQWVNEVGLENIVLKERRGAESKGVWVGISDLSQNVIDKVKRSPEEYIFQKKLNLANEFRVITVGGKQVWAAHRWGIRQLPFRTENIIPTFNKKLTVFAEEAAKTLPYEIGALDIGLTKEGAFKLIEAQRSFGSITNPFVSRRIKAMATGKVVGRLGIGLAAITGLTAYTFSAKDDAYNTIEGMSESGMAAQNRKDYNFGSGWLGKIANFFKGLFRRRRTPLVQEAFEALLPRGLKKGTLLSPYKAAQYAKETFSTEAFARKIGLKGNEFTILRTAEQERNFFSSLKIEASKKTLQMEGGPAFYIPAEQIGNKTGMIVVNQRQFPKLIQQIGVEFDNLTLEESLRASKQRYLDLDKEALTKQFLYHERLEMQSSAALASKNKVGRKYAFSHAAPEVPVGESIYTHLVGNKDIIDISKQMRHLASTIGEYGDELAYKIGENIFKGQNKSVIEIEGMKHGGIASIIRKIMTVFGSRADRIRVLAEAMGLTFEKLTARSSFQRALKEAKFIKEFGEGSFGKAFLYEGTYKGTSFKFVQKSIKPEAAELVAQSAAPNYYGKGLDVRNEAIALKKLGHTATVPSFYGMRGKDTLFMEYMPGETLYSYASKNPKWQLPESALKDIQETIMEASQQGLQNLDIHSGNVLFDPLTGRVSNIDWGLTVRKTHLSFQKKVDIMKAMTDKVKNIVGISRPAGIGSIAVQATSLDSKMLPYMKTPLNEAKVISGKGSSIDTAEFILKGKVKKNWMEKPLSSKAKRNLSISAQSLKHSKRELWDNAINGGKKHSRYSSVGGK